MRSASVIDAIVAFLYTCSSRTEIFRASECAAMTGMSLILIDSLHANPTTSFFRPVRPDVDIAITQCHHPYELPGFIMIEDGSAFVLTQGDIYVVSEGISPLLTETGVALAAYENEFAGVR